MNMGRNRLMLAPFLALLIAMTAGHGWPADVVAGALYKIENDIPLTEDECVDVGLANNSSLRSSREYLRATERAVWESYATFLPRVSSSFGASQTKISYSEFVTVEEKFTNYQAGVAVSQTLLSWEGIKWIHQARNSREAGRAGFEADRAELIYGIRTGCHDLLKMNDLLQVARENLLVGEEQLKLAEKMKEVGAGVTADVLKAKAQVESNRLDVITAEKNLAVARATLLSYLGLDVTLPLELERPAAGDLVIPSFEECLKTAREERPDLREQELFLRASEDAVGAAWGSHLPSVGGSISYGWRDDKFGSELFDDVNKTWTARISLDVPIFDVGTFSRISQRRANARAARWNLETTRETVAFEIQEAILSMEESAKKVDVAERNVAAAEEDLRISQGKYKHGLVPILDLIEAQASLAEARAAQVEANYDYLSSRAALNKAMGTGE